MLLSRSSPLLTSQTIKWSSRRASASRPVNLRWDSPELWCQWLLNVIEPTLEWPQWTGVKCAFPVWNDQLDLVFFFCNVVTFWWVMLFLWLCLFCLFVISISLHHLLLMLGRWVISKHEAALCYTFKSQSLQSHKKRPRLSSISLLQNNSRFPAFVTDNARLLFVFVVVLFGVMCVIWLGWRRASLESDSSSPWNGGRLNLLPSSLSPASQVTVYLS